MTQAWIIDNTGLTKRWVHIMEVRESYSYVIEHSSELMMINKLTRHIIRKQDGAVILNGPFWMQNIAPAWKDYTPVYFSADGFPKWWNTYL